MNSVEVESLRSYAVIRKNPLIRKYHLVFVAFVFGVATWSTSVVYLKMKKKSTEAEEGEKLEEEGRSGRRTEEEEDPSSDDDVVVHPPTTETDD